VTENKFRERRSAYRDETADEPGQPAAPPAEPPAAEAPPAEPSRPEEPGPPAEEEAADVMLEDEIGADPGMDLDRLAGMEVPEPSFLELIEPHVEMALRFLGELPLTPDGTRRVLPQWARREIDLLGLLEERTRGNLPPDEQGYLTQALDQLRTLYLKVGR
jgi:hypothetical protein